MLTTRQVAARLGVSGARVRQLIAAGRLPAAKHGRDWTIRERDLALVANRKSGRPVTTGAGIRRRDRRARALLAPSPDPHDQVDEQPG